MKKKERLERNLKEELHIGNRRGNTFVGVRSSEFKSVKDYDRKDFKRETKNLVKEEEDVKER